MRHRLPSRLAPMLLAALVALTPSAVSAAAGHTAGHTAGRLADYRPVDPPYVQRDRAGDASVLRTRLDRTDLTRREARAADFTRVDYAIAEHNGERSAQVAVTLRRLLPDRPRRHTQRVRVYFDEETFIDTNAHTEVSRYRSSAGGEGSPAPGCRALNAETVGAVVTSWIPVRCLLNDSSEMYVEGAVYATAPEAEAGRRLVGLDAAAGSAPFLRWR